MITRFAPSPTGPLHLGHAYSALLAHDMAMAQGGDFLLRIEDIDKSRARPEWEAQIYDDLRWLGLSWETPVLRQSQHSRTYAEALDHLWSRDLLYTCTCNRRDIAAASTAPQEGVPPIHGPDGLIYPGTCFSRQTLVPVIDARPDGVALRLDMTSATSRVMATRIGEGNFLSFVENGRGPEGQTGLIEFTDEDMKIFAGDIVLSRKDYLSSYHLSVVLDDADQGITDVVRGHDLFETTKIHVVLQRLLGLPSPTYHHHALIRDENGKRLAKRDDARAISTYRKDGASPEDIRSMVGL